MGIGGGFHLDGKDEGHGHQGFLATRQLVHLAHLIILACTTQMDIRESEIIIGEVMEEG